MYGRLNGNFKLMVRVFLMVAEYPMEEEREELHLFDELLGYVD